MQVVAYLTNIFPTSVEPYVRDEIIELRNRGIAVVPSALQPPAGSLSPEFKHWAEQTVYLRPLQPGMLLAVLWSCIRNFCRLLRFSGRALRRKRPSERRLHALIHTLLGVYYALLLKPFEVDHIHVHHGYVGSWIAMVAAELLGIDFSLTLHGSDLLLHAAYLDEKLRRCQFCRTISEFNRRQILDQYPEVDPAKIFISRLGVNCDLSAISQVNESDELDHLRILAIGRLHAVKDHAFLIKACRFLKQRGLPITCEIAGDGPERTNLLNKIHSSDLEGEVRLLGHVDPENLDSLYRKTDLVVLTSRSEGIPLVLMEAMAREKIVLAPQITGIPELVCSGRNGFLYHAGSLEDFAQQVEFIYRNRSGLKAIHHAAAEAVTRNFNRTTNTRSFCDRLQSYLPSGRSAKTSVSEEFPHEDPVLQ